MKDALSRRGWLAVAAVGLMLVLLTAACGSDPTATPAPTATSTPVPGEATPTPTATPGAAALFQAEWDTLIAAAQAEGRLVIGGGGSPSREYRELVNDFGDQFGVTVELSTGSGSDTVNRILVERDAGLYSVDIGLTSVNSSTTRLVPANALVPVSPQLIHPEVLDTSAWYQGQHWYADVGRELVFIYAAQPTLEYDIWYHTPSISAQEIATIQSPFDFLDAKWSGRVADSPWDNRSALGEMMEAYFAPDMGPEWVRQYIVEFGVTWQADDRILETWLSQGRFPLAWGGGAVLLQLEQLGIPIARVTIRKEQGTLAARGSGCCIMMYDRAPNPNAAKLFVNFFLTKEGQTAVHNVDVLLTRQSLRQDIPIGNVVQDRQRQEGVDYFFRDGDPDWPAKQKESGDFILQAWADRKT